MKNEINLSHRLHYLLVTVILFLVTETFSFHVRNGARIKYIHPTRIPAKALGKEQRGLP